MEMYGAMHSKKFFGTKILFINVSLLIIEDKIYGTVTWNGGESLKKPSYKLELETVYLCSTVNSDDFVPTYDPDGSIYKEGPQFGCSKPNRLLKHRILLLNRDKPIDDRFEAKFLQSDATRKCMNSNPIVTMDGFEFKLKNLFILDNRTNAFYDQNESLWYIQTIFVIRPLGKRDSERAKRLSLISTVYNNGTNIQSFRLVNKWTGHKKLMHNENGEKIIYQKNNTESNALLLKILIPISLMLILIFALVTVVYIKKRTLVELIRNKDMRRTKKEQISNFSKNISFKKMRKRLSSSSKNNNKKKKINLEDLFEGNLNEITNINTNDNKILDARNLSGENENCSGTNSTSDTIIIASPLLSNKQKSISSLNHSISNSTKQNKLITKENYNFQTNNSSNNAIFNSNSFNNRSNALFLIIILNGFHKNR
jgi:hypothetical protein